MSNLHSASTRHIDSLAASEEITRDASNSGPSTSADRIDPRNEFGSPSTTRFYRKSQIGAGGMGSVFEAQDQVFDRTVALKTLLPHVTGHRTARARFAFEAKVSGQLEHPGIPPVYDTGLDEQGRPYLAMRRVQGETLGHILNEIRDGNPAAIRDFPLPRLLSIFEKVCDAVAYAHSRAVIHRDLKPANIMVANFGEVFVMDWGLAKALPRGQSEELAQAQIDLEAAFPADETNAQANDLPPSDPADIELTGAGTILGSFGYMAPEQASGRSSQADERSDIYSLGAILYSILTLAAPIRGRDSTLMLDRIKSGDIRAPIEYSRNDWLKRRRPLPHLAKVPANLSHICMKALRTEPEERYPTVQTLQADLFAALNGKVTSAENATIAAR